MRDNGNKRGTIFLFSLFLILSLALIVHLVSMNFPRSYLYSDPRISRKNTRGTIYDRNGSILAFDTSSIGFNVVREGRRDDIAEFLSRYTDYGEETVRLMLENGILFFPLSSSSSLHPDIVEKALLEEHLDSFITFTSSPRRIYPYSSTYSIIGEAYSSYSGDSGIEKYFNSYLSSAPSLESSKNKGEDLVLTLDITLEEILYPLLENAGYREDAAILSPSGDILAYYGKIDGSLLSSLVYSHSTESGTTLFMRETVISTEDCVYSAPYYIYVSDNGENTLTLIKEELVRMGRSSSELAAESSLIEAEPDKVL